MTAPSSKLPCAPLPQLQNDPLSLYTFGEGRIKNLIYAAHANPPDAGPGTAADPLLFVSLLQSNDVEVRVVRGAPELGDASAPGGAHQWCAGVRALPAHPGSRSVHVLGLESSCDETAAAVVDVSPDGRARVVSDVIHSQVALHAEYGGVVPELASRDHLRNVAPVVKEALARARIELKDLDGIAVTNRPGLVGALLVGVQMAKALAWSTDVPFVGVDHLVGHLLAVFLERDGEPAAAQSTPSLPSFPYAALLASGGHTALYRVDAPRAESIVELGATRDDAAGEAFDKVAKLLGLGYPGGPIVDRLAAEGDAHAFAIPIPMNDKASLEFSFSGVKTWVARHVARARSTRLAAGAARPVRLLPGRRHRRAHQEALRRRHPRRRARRRHRRRRRRQPRSSVSASPPTPPRSACAPSCRHSPAAPTTPP